MSIDSQILEISDEQAEILIKAYNTSETISDGEGLLGVARVKLIFGEICEVEFKNGLSAKYRNPLFRLVKK